MELRYVLLVIAVLFLASCKPEPEFYIKGKPFYTRTRCVESHTISYVGYRYGMGFNGKMGYYLGPVTETICDKKVTDTIEIIK